MENKLGIHIQEEKDIYVNVVLEKDKEGYYF